MSETSPIDRILEDPNFNFVSTGVEGIKNPNLLITNLDEVGGIVSLKKRCSECEDDLPVPVIIIRLADDEITDENSVHLICPDCKGVLEGAE